MHFVICVKPLLHSVSDTILAERVIAWFRGTNDVTSRRREQSITYGFCSNQDVDIATPMNPSTSHMGTTKNFQDIPLLLSLFVCQGYERNVRLVFLLIYTICSDTLYNAMQIGK
jgi:hypothetical protein